MGNNRYHRTGSSTLSPRAKRLVMPKPHSGQAESFLGSSSITRRRRAPCGGRGDGDVSEYIAPVCLASMRPPQNTGGNAGVPVVGGNRHGPRRSSIRLVEGSSLSIRRTLTEILETPGRRAASITAKAAGEVGWPSPGARIGPDGRLKWR